MSTIREKVKAGDIINGWEVIETNTRPDSEDPYCRALCPSCFEEGERRTYSLRSTGQCMKCRAANQNGSSNNRLVQVKKLTRNEREELAHIETEIADIKRPLTRRDCASVPRPCPFVSCRWHLYLSVTHVGSLKMHYPGKEVESLSTSCALDEIEQGAKTLSEVGNFFGLTRERIRQVEDKALNRLRQRIDGSPIKEELLLYLTDAANTDQDKRDLTLYDPNPKHLTWDEWRKKFVAKIEHGREERKTDDRILRHTTRDLGELHPLQEHLLKPIDLPPVPPAEPETIRESSPPKDQELAPDLPSISVDATGDRGVPEGVSDPSPHGRTRKQKPPEDTQLKRERAQLSYAILSRPEDQMLSLAKELCDSPYLSALQDHLRRFLANSLVMGKRADAQKAQQCLAVLYGKEPKRKEAPMEKEQAQKLLDLLAARPDKADLIEALAESAGLLHAPASSLSAMPKIDRDLKPEKTAQKPKKSAAEGKKEPKKSPKSVTSHTRFLTGPEKDKVNRLVASGWTKSSVAKELDVPISTFFHALKGKYKISVIALDKLAQLLPKQAEAAE